MTRNAAACFALRGPALLMVAVHPARHRPQPHRTCSRRRDTGAPGRLRVAHPSRTGGHDPGRRPARHQRDHGEGTPRPGDAKDGGRLPRRPRDNGRQTPPRACAESLTLQRPVVLRLIFSALLSTPSYAGCPAYPEKGFVLTGPDLPRTDGRPRGWTLDRDPFLLETSVPGVFAAGDVRAGSSKRVAAAVGEGSITVHLVHQYLATL